MIHLPFECSSETPRRVDTLDQTPQRRRYVERRALCRWRKRCFLLRPSPTSRRRIAGRREAHEWRVVLHPCFCAPTPVQEAASFGHHRLLAKSWRATQRRVEPLCRMRACHNSELRAAAHALRSRLTQSHRRHTKADGHQCQSRSEKENSPVPEWMHSGVILQSFQMIRAKDLFNEYEVQFR